MICRKPRMVKKKWRWAASRRSFFRIALHSTSSLESDKYVVNGITGKVAKIDEVASGCTANSL